MEDDFATVTMKARLGCDCKVIPQNDGRCVVKLSAATHRSNGVTIWHDITWFTSSQEQAVIDRMLKGAMIFVQGDLDEYNGKKGIRASHVSILRDPVQRVEEPDYPGQHEHHVFQEDQGPYGHGQIESNDPYGAHGYRQEHVSAPRPAPRQAQAPRPAPPRAPAPQHSQRTTAPRAAIPSSGAGTQLTPQHRGPAPARPTAPRPAQTASRVAANVVW